METEHTPVEGAPVVGEPRGLTSGELETDMKLFHDYHIDTSTQDAVLTFDLPDGQKWKKRIWPRLKYPRRLLRWCTVEEIVSYLISFSQHHSWVSTEVPDRPPSGTILFFDRSQTRKFQNDGYDWKRRTAGHVRQDRMKLKVSGQQMIYGCYAHSASQSNFHRRSYWLINNPSIVLVHYLISESLPTQEPEECCITPSHFEMLAISDCNICSLIAMVTKEGAVPELIDILSKILLLNIRRARSISDAIESSNNGLPFNRFEETRTKKLRSRVVEESSKDSSAQLSSSDQVVQSTSGVQSAAAEGVEVSASLESAMRNDRGISIPPITVKRKNAQASNVLPGLFGLDLEFLFQALVSASTRISEGGANRLIQSKRNTPILPEKERRKSDAKESPVLKNKTNKGTRGKERAAPPTTTVHAREAASYVKPNSKDYDAEKFTDFTKFLVQMDPLVPINHTTSLANTSTTSAMDSSTTTAGGGPPPTEAVTLPHTLQSRPVGEKCLEVLPELIMPLEERMEEDGASEGIMSVSQYLSMEVTNNIGPLATGNNEAIAHGHMHPTSPQALSTSSTFFPSLSESTTSSNTLLQSSTSDRSPHSIKDQPLQTNTTSIPPSSSSMLSVSIPQVVASSTSTSSNSSRSNSNSFTDNSHIHNGDHHLTSLQSNDFLSSIALDLDPSALEELFQCSNTHTRSVEQFGDDDFIPQEMDLQDTSTANQCKANEATPLSPITHFMDSLTPADFELGSSSSNLESNHPYHPSSPSSSSSQLPLQQQQLQNSQSSCKTRDQDSGLGMQHRPESDVSMSNTSERNSTQRFSSASEISTDNYLPAVDGMFSHNLFQSQSASSSNDNTQDLSRNRSVSDPQNTGANFAFSDGSTLPNLSLSSASFQGTEKRHTLPKVVVSSDGATGGTSAVSSASNPWQGGGGGGGEGGGGDGGMVDPVLLWLDSTYSAAAGNVDEVTNQTMLMAEPHPTVDLSLQPRGLSAQGDSNTLFPSDTDSAVGHEVWSDADLATAGPLHSLSTQDDSELSSNSMLDFFNIPPGSDLFSIGATNERKISNVSSVSEPAYQPHTGSTLEEVNDMLQLQMPPSFMTDQASSSSDGIASRAEVQKPLHLSLPDLTFESSTTEKVPLTLQNMLTVQSTSGYVSPVINSPSLSRLSLSPLQDIPEGVQMELENPLSFLPMSLDPEQFHYRESSPIPSSPSVASISSPSLFDSTESPSVVELCELIGESSSVQHGDFSHLTLSDAEKDQLFGAAQTIQSAFRNYKHKSKMKSREKNAALLIENYYKRYKELKQQKDQAARRIQQQYRNYRSRSRELNRAAVFIQQMYRYHRIRTRSPDSEGDSAN